MTKPIILVALLLAGCVSGIQVEWIRATPEQIAQWCSKGANGCYKVFAGVCTVIAPDPPVRIERGKRVYDQGQWGTLGHELKHCFDGEFHD